MGRGGSEPAEAACVDSEPQSSSRSSNEIDACPPRLEREMKHPVTPRAPDAPPFQAGPKALTLKASTRRASLQAFPVAGRPIGIHV